MIARVFPQRTSATPRDELAFIGDPPLFLPRSISEVHVSATFTWDLPEAQRLVRAWARIAPVKLGGPATGMRGEGFTPGLYLRQGYTITSRGCPNHCWFCTVPQREGPVRELSVMPGNVVLDDNLLACSRQHVEHVFAMLERQHEVSFTGGLEAARLQPWHAEALWKLRPRQMFFAFDTENDWEPLVEAGRLLRALGFRGKSPRRPHRALRAYVLVGFPKDTLIKAEQRLRATWDVAGFVPMAMLWQPAVGEAAPGWASLHKTWSRPAMTAAAMKRPPSYACARQG
jgi:hypothetical protein